MADSSTVYVSNSTLASGWATFLSVRGAGVVGAGGVGRGLGGRAEEVGQPGQVERPAQILAGHGLGGGPVGARQLLVLVVPARGGAGCGVVAGARETVLEPEGRPDHRAQAHGQGRLTPGVGLLLGGAPHHRGRRPRGCGRGSLRVLRDTGFVRVARVARVARGGSRAAAGAQGTHDHAHTQRRPQQEHRADDRRHPSLAVDESHVEDAYAEHRPDEDEQRLADPEGEETDEVTEHPVITSGARSGRL
ncbi:hypothetical protein RKD21_006081 [Streptomyces albogriseolus]|uniref:Uncharacterized protein n=1 Tax=Streptomyces albogriseolus TaxID=1887 RepID=A0ACC6UWC9_STRAO